MATMLECKVYFVLKEYEFKKHGNRHKEQLRMVSWNNGEPLIERRQFVLNVDGEYKARKARGLSKEDFAFIEKHKDKIETVWKEYFDGRKEDSV